MSEQSRMPSLGRRGGGWVGIQFLLIGALIAAGVRGRADIEGALLMFAFVLGTSIIAFGTVIMSLGIRQLNRSLSVMPRPVDEGTLVEDGVFAYVRHPIYLGLIIVGVGWSVAMDSVAALIVSLIFAIFLDLKARREEAWLRAQYREYAAYAERTKRFVPYVY